MLMPPGDVLVVNLPTASGKSLVAYAPSLAAKTHNQLTVVIVPTVALGLDQERAYAALAAKAGVDAPFPFAYHGGLSPEDKQTIRTRVRNGQQRLLFASPEGFVTGLSAALLEAARQGSLRYLVVDEAHLVAQWGVGFRPEFQVMAGLWRQLRSLGPADATLRTVLMTATLTDEALRTLKTFFGDVSIVAAPELRPEPEYWVSACAGEQSRSDRLEALLRYVPRPFVLYVTRRKDAETWYSRVRAMGMHRVGLMHGGSSDREQTIQQWASRELDAVVATSAFGLGVDQAEVRTVIHACVPETVDRFYQEVGRGGRDGNASASIMLWTTADQDIARSLAQEPLIGIEKGFGRWKTMHANRDSRAGGSMRLRLDSVPSGIVAHSERNRSWNLRTLTLMARAGLIEFIGDQLPALAQRDDESDSEYAERREREYSLFANTIRIRLLRGGLNDRSLWETCVEPERQRARTVEQEDQGLFNRLLSGEEEFGRLFSHTYRVAIGDEELFPSPCCRSCPECRRTGAGLSSMGEAPPRGQFGVRNSRRCSDFVRRLAGHDGELVPVCYGQADRLACEAVDALVRVLIRRGLPAVFTDAPWLRSAAVQRGWRTASAEGFVVVGELDDLSQSVLHRAPVVAVVDDSLNSSTRFAALRTANARTLVCLYPAQTRMASGKRVTDIFDISEEIHPFLSCAEVLE
jgi:superfamily II DNA/RNA helicase